MTQFDPTIDPMLQFIDELRANPQAPAPAYLDDNAITLARELAQEFALPARDDDRRARIWQQVLEETIAPRRVQTGTTAMAPAQSNVNGRFRFKEGKLMNASLAADLIRIPRQHTPPGRWLMTTVAAACVIAVVTIWFANSVYSPSGEPPNAGAGVLIAQNLTPTVSGTMPSPVIQAMGELEIRQGPGLEYPVTLILTEGGSFSVIGRTEDNNWYQAMLRDGMVGWIAAPPDEGTALGLTGDMMDSEEIPVIDPADIPAAIASATPNRILASPTPYPDSIILPDNPGVEVRQGPRLEYPVIAVITVEVPVTIIDRTEDDDWLRVLLPDGTVGWIFAPPGEEPPLLNVTRTPMPPTAPTRILVTPTPIASPSPIQGVEVRQGPGLGYPILSLLAEDAPVAVIDRTPDDDWLRVRLSDGTIGWIYSPPGEEPPLLNVTRTPAPVTDPSVATVPVLPTYTPLPTYTIPPSEPMVISVTPSPTERSPVVAVREGPGPEYPPLFIITVEVPFDILDQTDDGQWIQVMLRTLPQGTVGWITAESLDAMMSTWGTIPNYARRIGIIAGHSGPENDPGAVCLDENGAVVLTEREVNSAVAFLVWQELRDLSYNVDLLEEWDSRLHGYHADALVSIHANTCSEDYVDQEGNPLSGFLVDKAETRSWNMPDGVLVNCIAASYSEATQLEQRFDLPQDMAGYHAFQKISATTPGAIIEIGFMLGDRELITTRADLVARGIADGILCYLDEEDTPPVVTATPDPFAPTITPFPTVDLSMPSSVMMATATPMPTYTIPPSSMSSTPIWLTAPPDDPRYLTATEIVGRMTATNATATPTVDPGMYPGFQTATAIVQMATPLALPSYTPWPTPPPNMDPRFLTATSIVVKATQVAEEMTQTTPPPVIVITATPISPEPVAVPTYTPLPTVSPFPTVVPPTEAGTFAGITDGTVLEISEQLRFPADSAWVWSPDGRLLAVASENHIAVYDTSDLQAAPITLEGYAAGPVLSLAFDPTGTLLASSSMEGAIRLWDIREGHIWGGIPVCESPCRVDNLSFSADGRVLVVEAEGEVRMWAVP